MSHTQEPHNPGERVKTWRKVNAWSIKGPLLVLALLLGFFGGALNWKSAPFAAGVAMIIPIIGFRAFWTEARFWVTVVLLGAAQVPLVLAVGPLLQQLKFPFMFTFGIFDCALMVLAISWVCSKHGGKGV